MNGKKKIALLIEFILLFFGIPLFIFFEKSIIHPVAFLLPVLAVLVFYFRKQKDFKTSDLVRLGISKKEWGKQGIAVFFTSLFLIVFVLIFEPENLFNLPKGNPAIWIVLLFFYPIFSAYGQEVLYRKFIFKRYQPLFNQKWMIFLASGVAFSFVHIIYFSVLSLVLTFFAGIYLAKVYDKTKSVLFTAIIHGILGFIIFTVGLGQHFWIDMMKWL